MKTAKVAGSAGAHGAIIQRIETLAREISSIAKSNTIEGVKTTSSISGCPPLVSDASSTVSPSPSPLPPSAPEATTAGTSSKAVTILRPSPTPTIAHPQPTVHPPPPPPIPFLDRTVHENTRARFGDGLRIEMVSTPFEPRRVTVIRIPVPLELENIVTSEQEHAQEQESGQGKGGKVVVVPSSSSSFPPASPRHPTTGASAGVTTVPSSSPAVMDKFTYTEEIMRAVFDTFGCVLSCDFKRVGVGDSSHHRPSPSKTRGGRTNGYGYRGRNIPKSTTSNTLSSSTSSSTSNNNERAPPELIAHVEYAHHQEAASAVRGLNDSALQNIPIQLSLRDSLLNVSAPTPVSSSITKRPTVEKPVVTIFESDPNSKSNANSNATTNTGPAQRKGSRQMKGKSKQEALKSTSSTNVTTTTSSTLTVPSPIASSKSQKQSIKLPLTVSATFTKIEAPTTTYTTSTNNTNSGSSTAQSSASTSMIISDTVLIKWDVPRPKIRLYFSDPRVARREVEIIGKRMFFGRRLEARLVGRSGNVVVVDGVRFPVQAVVDAVRKREEEEAKAAGIASAPGGANASASASKKKETEKDKGKGKGQQVMPVWRGELDSTDDESDEEEREERLIQQMVDAMGPEVKELQRRHRPDTIRIFEEGYVHEDVMQSFRAFISAEQERSRSQEDLERGMMGLGPESLMGDSIQGLEAVAAGLKVGLKEYEINEYPGEPVPTASTMERQPRNTTTLGAQTSVSILVRFHESSSALSFYNSLQTFISSFRWRRSGRLLTILSKDLLYVMTAEKYAVLLPQIDQLRQRLAAAQLRIQAFTPSGSSVYRHLRIIGGGHKRAFKPMIDALLVGEVIMKDPSSSTSPVPSASTSTPSSSFTTTTITVLKPLWDDELDFLYGMQNIVNVVLMPTETQILIDRPRRHLIVFGPVPARRNLAKQRLIQKMEESRKRLKVVIFDRNLLRYYVQAYDRQLVPQCGKQNVWLDPVSCRVTAAGQRAVQCLADVQRKAPKPEQLMQLLLVDGEKEKGKKEKKGGSDSLGQCPVCLGEPENPVEGIGCGHSYCEDCLVQYLLCAIQPGGTLPVLCFGVIYDSAKQQGGAASKGPNRQNIQKARRGQRGNGRVKESKREANSSIQDNTPPPKTATTTCNTLIPLPAIKRLLTAEQLDIALKASFDSYIRARPEQYHHCPTSDCPEIYRVFDNGSKGGAATSTGMYFVPSLLTVYNPSTGSPLNVSASSNDIPFVGFRNAQHCPSCLIRVCPVCFAEGGHDGFSCDQYKQQQLDLLAEEAAEVETWIKKFGGRKCPNCQMGLLKDGGCAHVRCSRCGIHICWTCGKTFGEVEKESIYEHMTRVHGSIGLMDWGDDRNAARAGWGDVEEMEERNRAAIMRVLEETDDVRSPEPPHSRSGSNGGSVGVANRDNVRGGGRGVGRGGRGGATREPNNNRVWDTRQKANSTGGFHSRGRGRYQQRRGQPPRRSYHHRYETRDEFSEDENDDFGGGHWDFDFADMDWESL